MPRSLRLEFAGALVYVVSRGNGGLPIFRDDTDRRHFLDVLGETSCKTSWKIHAYCLLPEEFHLLTETPQANLVAGMKWLLGTYTMSFNRRHGTRGHLFAGRYRSLPIDAETASYVRTIGNYVHLQPAYAEQWSDRKPLRDYAWNSLQYYAGTMESVPGWLCQNRLLSAVSQPASASGDSSRWLADLEALRQSKASPEWQPIRRGWCFGSNAFRQKLLEHVCLARSQKLPAPWRSEQSERAAEHLIEKELHQNGWSTDDLSRHRKGDPFKVKLAQKLRQETTVSLQWIAARLKMGSWTHVSNLLSLARGRARQRQKPPHKRETQRKRVSLTAHPQVVGSHSPEAHGPAVGANSGQTQKLADEGVRAPHVASVNRKAESIDEEVSIFELPTHYL